MVKKPAQGKKKAVPKRKCLAPELAKSKLKLSCFTENRSEVTKLKVLLPAMRGLRGQGENANYRSQGELNIHS